jgi:hypothetical protein
MEQPAAVTPGWRKSSHSTQSGGGSCVEAAALPWRKSSFSGQSGGGSCVEAAHAPGAILVRDTTQHGAGPVLRVTAADWAAFTASIKH